MSSEKRVVKGSCVPKTVIINMLIAYFTSFHFSGDHVVPLYVPQCRECKFCKNPKTNLCQKIRFVQSIRNAIKVSNIQIFMRDRMNSNERGDVWLFRRITQGRGQMPDGTSRFTCKGKSVAHFMGCSTFSEYTVVAEISLCKVCTINRDLTIYTCTITESNARVLYLAKSLRYFIGA